MQRHRGTCRAAGRVCSRRAGPGDGLVVHDAGAYCMSMASNYNLKVRCVLYVKDLAVAVRPACWRGLMRRTWRSHAVVVRHSSRSGRVLGRVWRLARCRAA